MRGIDLTFSRLPATRALIAGAALLASGAVGKVCAQPRPSPEETAFAQPRIAPRGGAPVGLPQPLPPSEAARIRHIFALQKAGKVAEAAREVEGLDTGIVVNGVPVGHAMLGHILADRHLGRFSKPSADILQYWLASFSDLPDASAIHALLTARLPRGEKPPPPPAVRASLSASATPSVQVPATAPVPEETETGARAFNRSSSLDRSVWDAARGKPGTVERLLSKTSGLSASYASQLRGEAGQILFTSNRDEEAYDVAAAGARVCEHRIGCQDAALAGYMAGLAAWRMGRFEQARPMFEAAWRAENTTSSLRAAAAFWAARTRLRLHDPANYVPWMTRAAAERRTFYGLLARRTLGLDIGFAPGGRADKEVLTQADVDAVYAFPEGVRAFALLQVGQDSRAEAELRRLWPAAQGKAPLARALMLVAQTAGLEEFAAQLADFVAAADGRPREDVRFPIPHLRPDGGWKIDPAIVYGLARTESNFDTQLVSSAGARGLMQIMPETASFIVHATPGGGGGGLYDAEYNLDLGQRYVMYLAGQEQIGGNLLKLLASYNSGPGKFAKWGTQVRDDGDPLLFIEAIPIDETRAFVPRVLTYTWIYAARLRQPVKSLDELAAGAWPRYHPLNERETAVGRLN